MLIAAMNPCKCGYHGDPKRDCRCSPREVENYRNRISGPLLDRIDIHAEVPAVTFQELQGRGDGGESSAIIRARAEAARDIQGQRFGAATTTTNASMSSRQLKACCQLDETSRGYLEQAMNELHLSARAHDRILKVARTLADLAASEHIRADDILEAVQFRSLDRKLFS